MLDSTPLHSKCLPLGLPFPGASYPMWTTTTTPVPKNYRIEKKVGERLLAVEAPTMDEAIELMKKAFKE